MSENSYPRVGKSMGEDQWRVIGLAIGRGILDEGGWPYLIKNVDSVNDQVTIAITQSTRNPENHAFLQGFVHEMTADVTLDVPPVAADTTYEVGLLYDPAGHDTEDGPLKLAVWTTPVDNTGGKARLVLYKILRRPNVTLQDSQIIENRERISNWTVVTGTADLPDPTTGTVDEFCFIRATQDIYRLKIDVDGTKDWTLVDFGSAELSKATYEATPNTIAKRAANGSMWAAEGTGDLSVINKKYLWENATGGLLDAAGKLVARGGDSNFLVPEPVHNSHPATKGYVDGHNWDGADITTGKISAYRVNASYDAFARAWPGTGAIRTVHAMSDGGLCYWSDNTSTIRLKTNVTPYARSIEELLGPEPVEFDRLHPETLEPMDIHEPGFIAEHAAQFMPELVEYEPDEDGNPQVVGWKYPKMAAGFQKLHRHHAAETTALRAENEHLKNRIAAIEHHLGLTNEETQP